MSSQRPTPQRAASAEARSVPIGERNRRSLPRAAVWINLGRLGAVVLVFLVAAWLVGAQNIVGLDLVAAVMAFVALYQLVRPVDVAWAVIFMLVAGAFWLAVQSGGPLVRQPATAGLPFAGSPAIADRSTLSLFGVSSGELGNASLMVAFEGLCMLVCIRAMEWWRRGRSPSPTLPGGSPVLAVMWALKLRMLVWGAAGLVVYLGSRSPAQTLVVELLLGVALVRVLHSFLYMAAALLQVSFCSVLLTLEHTGLIARWQDGVSFFAARGVTSFEPSCDIVGFYAAVLMLAAALGHRGDHAALDSTGPCHDYPQASESAV